MAQKLTLAQHIALGRLLKRNRNELLTQVTGALTVYPSRSKPARA